LAHGDLLVAKPHGWLTTKEATSMISTHSIRLAQMLVCAAIAIPLALPAVAKGGGDWFERYAAAHPYGIGALGARPTPDTFERYATAHPYGIAAPGGPAGTLDTFERYASSHPYGIRVQGT
jgi:hypothetical protein